MKNSIELRTGALNNYDTELVVVDIYQAPAPRTLINHKFSYNTLDWTSLNANAKLLHYKLFSRTKFGLKNVSRNALMSQGCRSLWEPQLARFCIS